MTVEDALLITQEVGLRYVNDEMPGIRRIKRGRGFSYVAPDGSAITREEERHWIAGIAIPPAWTDVWISPHRNGHILATGRDQRGRKQYRYHPKWREVRDANKYGRLCEFGAELPRVRKELDNQLAVPALPREKVLAAVLSMLDQTLIRVGNEEYAVSNDSFGLTTITSDHADVSGSTVRLRFPGKSKVWRDTSFRDAKLAKIVKKCEELPGHELFKYIDDDGEVADVSSSDVNDYLRRLTDHDFTAKDFRTWGGTVIFATSLIEVGPPETKTELKQKLNDAFDSAAKGLGNTRTVCRNCYVHPAIAEAYEEGELFEAWRTSRDAAYFDRGERTTLRILENRSA